MIPLAKSFSHNLHIEELDLYDNNIGKKGAPVIAEALKSLTALKKLNLGDCMLGSKGAKLVLKSLKQHTALEHLVRFS